VQTTTVEIMDAALGALRAGRPVVLAHGQEGDLMLLAEHATAERTAFALRHGSGFICVAMEDADVRRLALPQMVDDDTLATDFTVTVDAAAGVSTGVSAADRAHTCRVLADPGTTASDLHRPGHVLPLRARPGGVLQRPGHAEAAVDLARLCDTRSTAMLVSQLINGDGTVRRRSELVRFATEHDLPLLAVDDVVRHRLLHERHVELLPPVQMPTRFGTFRAVGCQSLLDGREHLALIAGEIGGGEDVLVRIHLECLLGDVFGGGRCACRVELTRSLEEVMADGRGVILYLRDHEDRLEALSDAHRDRGPGHDDGLRTQILTALGVQSVRAPTASSGAR
jgi:3,4-dihydroxy 2-butanone 4-phosphate synthase/GTP cyclohydrolase II